MKIITVIVLALHLAGCAALVAGGAAGYVAGNVLADRERDARR